MGEEPFINSNGLRLKSCDENCSNRKDVAGRNTGKDQSCFYCWRKFSEGAKKPTYMELFALENSRQQMLSSKQTLRPRSIHISTPSLSRKTNGRLN